MQITPRQNNCQRLGRVAQVIISLVFGCLSVTAEETFLIDDALVFDVRTLTASKKDVVVKNGRFVSIEDEISHKEYENIVEAEGKALLPGLIDIHTHWTRMGGATRASIARDLLQAGVTSATDFHTSPEAFAVKREFHKELLSPHVFYTARIGVPFGHGLEWGDSNMTASVYGPVDAEAATHKILRFKPDAIKVFADGWRYGYGVNQSSINTNALAKITSMATESGLPVFTHTVTVDGAKLAAKSGVTAIVHAVQDNVADAELVELLRANGVFYAPTLAVYEPRPDKLAQIKRPEVLKIIQKRQSYSRANLYRFNEEGIPVALGTDQGIDSTWFGSSDHRELELLVDFGMTPAEALAAGTINSALALGVGKDRGAIEQGMRADFMLVEGTPWENISDIKLIDQVYVDGVKVVEEGALIHPQSFDYPKAQKARSDIDTFEKDGGLTAYGAARLLIRDRGFPRSKANVAVVRRADGGRALHVSAKMALKKTPSAFIVLPFSPEGFVPLDASEFRGVKFEVRGEGHFTAKLSSLSAVGTSDFLADENWKEVRMDFETFLPNIPEAVDLQNLLSVEFGRHGQAGEPFWFEIDNVQFYK